MRFRGHVLIMLLFVLFIVEGTIIPWLIPGGWQYRLSPNLVFIIILFVSVYYHRHTALVLGIILGLLHDIIFYGAMIGPYSFAMGCAAYLMGLIFQAPRAPMPIMMTVVLLGSLLFDSTLFGIYQLFQLNVHSFNWALTQYMIPNLCVHFLFALIIYVPMRKQFELLGGRPKKEENV